jgi:hypothetical protein
VSERRHPLALTPLAYLLTRSLLRSTTLSFASKKEGKKYFHLNLITLPTKGLILVEKPLCLFAAIKGKYMPYAIKSE